MLTDDALTQYRYDVCKILIEEFEFSPEAALDAYVSDIKQFQDAFVNGITADDAIVHMILTKH